MAKILTKPGSNKTTAKTIVFDPDEWTAFEERTRQLGMSTSSFFRKVVSDYLQGRYIHLDTVQPGVFEELQRRKKDLNLTNVQPVLDMILADWLDARPGKRR